MTIDELMNKLATELPDGAQVQLCVENGAGWVNAQDWDGNEWDGENTDASIEQRVIDALEWCNERETMTANGEVRGASRPDGEASSREAATSTVVLGNGGSDGQ